MTRLENEDNEGLSALSLPPETLELLQKHHFDLQQFGSHRQRLRRGQAGPAQNRITGVVTPPRDGDVHQLPAPDSVERARLAELGNRAIRAGKVATILLAGGMATRFGGVVKAAVEVLDGQSFLDLKLRDLGRAAASAQGRIPLLLMASFATSERIRSMVDGRATGAVPIEVFDQYISLRLTPRGDIFRDSSGSPSPYAPGHGDLPYALRASGLLDRLTSSGIELLYMTNVDNLGATLDPAVIGLHLESRAAISVEVAEKAPGDRGGAPARVDGDLQIVEGFRFPDEFDQDSIPVFNTNSMVLHADTLQEGPDLSWFAVDKKVDGEPVVQFEHLVGELTAHAPCACIAVQREGADGRFVPVKDPQDLSVRKGVIRQLLTARGIL